MSGPPQQPPEIELEPFRKNTWIDSKFQVLTEEYSDFDYIALRYNFSIEL